ncbi:uncharacterized protein UTRI_03933 [Ustilago trichophora]|uniref:Uncharacterized protein n=1 Tax=Ustilago trichophora TaxID=86804 RepID=A0A5C3E6K1_9BASI|nr:uncharacterized protein UTRI_03933 [Ustilago trichophora]
MQFIRSNQQRGCHPILLLMSLIAGLAGQLTLALPMIRGGGMGEKLLEKGKNVLSDYLAYTQSSPEPEEIVEEELSLLHLDSSPSLSSHDHVGPYHHHEVQQHGWNDNSQSGPASKFPQPLYSPRSHTSKETQQWIYATHPHPAELSPSPPKPYPASISSAQENFQIWAALSPRISSSTSTSSPQALLSTSPSRRRVAVQEDALPMALRISAPRGTHFAKEQSEMTPSTVQNYHQQRQQLQYEERSKGNRPIRTGRKGSGRLERLKKFIVKRVNSSFNFASPKAVSERLRGSAGGGGGDGSGSAATSGISEASESASSHSARSDSRRWFSFK